MQAAPYAARMSPTLRQQISASIHGSECRIEKLKAQAEPNQNAIASEERELQILRRKFEAVPEETPGRAPAMMYA